MKKVFVYGTAVLALSAAPLFAQAGGSGATDQSRARSGAATQGGSTTGSQPGSQPGSTTGSRGGARAGAQGGKEMSANDEHRFVMDAAVGSMAEVELGRLATERASNDRVKQFGQRMVTDHGKANDELKALAQTKNITLPSDLDERHKATRDRLAKLSGDAFDRAYMREMVMDHRKDVTEFRRESQSGKDPDIKAWAAKMLPTLEDHLKQAQDISRSIGAVGTSGRSKQGGTTGSTGKGSGPGSTGSGGKPDGTKNPR